MATAEQLRKYSELQTAMGSCYGSEQRYKRSIFGCDTGMVYTQGIKTFAEVAGAQWFIDMVNSHTSRVKKDLIETDNFYYSVKLEVSNLDSTGLFTVQKEDVNTGELIDVVTQVIPFTDLPRDMQCENTHTTYNFYLFAEGMTVEDCILVLLLTSEN